MAGRGPSPKDPSTRARTNADVIQMRILPRAVAEQPILPTVYVFNSEGERRRFNWPTITKQWWQMWADSPLSTEFTSTDWSELRDTALLHARYWSGEVKLAAELRLRTAKFGATPEDRARLRIQFAQAVEAEQKAINHGPSSSRNRFANMRIPDEIS